MFNQLLMKKYFLFLTTFCVVFQFSCKYEKSDTRVSKEAVLDPVKLRVLNQTKNQILGNWNVTGKLTVDKIISINPMPYGIEAIWDFRANDSIYSLGIFARTYAVIDSATLLIGGDTFKYNNVSQEFHLKSKLVGNAFVEMFGKKIIEND